jgi:glycosyltransferase involved in cell wall biosynthesis
MLKGFDYFVEAIRLLSDELEQREKVEILLFGKSRGDLSGHFPFKTQHIEFTGSMKTLVDLYSAAELFAIPSLQDNLPNTIIEAMLCGTPVVGFKAGGIPEMIEHKVDGYLAESRSVNDLAQGIRWILESENPEALSKAARDGAVKRFSRKKSAEMHKQLYSKLLDQHIEDAEAG